MVDIKTLEDETDILITEQVINAGIAKPILYLFIKNNGYEQLAQGYLSAFS